MTKQLPQTISIPELVKKRVIKSYPIDDKLPMFATLVYHRQPEVTINRKVKQIAQKYWIEFEQIKCNRRTLKDILKKYKGFSFDDDNLARFSKFFKININFYEYNPVTKNYEVNIVFSNKENNDTLNIMVTDRVYYVKDVAKINIEPPCKDVIVDHSWVETLNPTAYKKYSKRRVDLPLTRLRLMSGKIRKRVVGLRS
jgi:hypothetical protein